MPLLCLGNLGRIVMRIDQIRVEAKGLASLVQDVLGGALRVLPGLSLLLPPKHLELIAEPVLEGSPVSSSILAWNRTDI